jgi:hypothetical protein
MPKLGQIVIYVSNKLKDGKRDDDTVADVHVPLLVCVVNKDGSVDGYTFGADKTEYVSSVMPGTPSDPGKFYIYA